MRLILFDVDGTLVDARGGGARALLNALNLITGKTFERKGVPFAGRTDRAIVADLLQSHGIAPSMFGQVMHELHTIMPDRMEAEMITKPAVALPGVIDLLHALRGQPVLLGLSTGNFASSARIKLQSAGIDPSHFALGAYGNESVDRNTLPKLALERAMRLNDSTPNSVVVVGDTPSDIHSAIANSFDSVAVATGPYSVSELEKSDPDHVFDTLEETDAVLKALLGNPGLLKVDRPV